MHIIRASQCVVLLREQNDSTRTSELFSQLLQKALTELITSTHYKFLVRTKNKANKTVNFYGLYFMCEKELFFLEIGLSLSDIATEIVRRN